MDKKLPTKLGVEPLFDALFELRFSNAGPASGAFPIAAFILTTLYTGLGAKEDVAELSTAQLPKALRDADPSLHYAPTHRFPFGRFNISTGDRNVIINATYPYAGWSDFKELILKVIHILLSDNKMTETLLIGKVERYSLKYLDLIPINTNQTPSDLVNLDLRIGSSQLDLSSFSVRTDLVTDNFVNIIEIMTNANIILNDVHKSGLLLTVDTIKELKDENRENLVAKFSEDIDLLHLENKSLFFDCLKNSAVQKMEPIYE